jgi:outer membrane cobalamin receptor
LAAFLWLFFIPAFGAVHGTVRDTSGAVVPRARVYLLRAPLPAQAVLADSSGAFRFAEAGAGSCTVFASAQGLSGDKVEARCDRAEALELTLRPSAVVETVVVKAERAELPSTAVASSVSVLTAEDLRAMQAIHLIDALRYLPGVEVNQTGRRGGVTGVFVRGAESKYNLVTLDGVKVNDFGGSYNFTSLPAEQAERVEVVRGPQSAQYGSYAIGSAVHVVTPSGLDGRDLFASAEGGNFATRRFTAGGGDRIGNLGIHASASRFQTDGIAANDDSRIDNGRLKADYRMRRHRWQYSFLVNSNESGNPGAIGTDPAGTFRGLDPVTRTFEHYNVHSFRYDAELGSRVRQRLSGAIYSDRLDFRSRFGPSFSRQSRNAFGTETSVALGRGDLLVFGMEWNGERFRNSFLTDGSVPFPVERSIYGWFVEHHLERGGKFFLNTGARLEHLRLDAIPRPAFPASQRAQLHPKLSAAYLLLRDTRLHASAGTGLRPPDGFELAFTDNPALKPERTASFDAGLQQAFLDRRLAVDLTWFYNRFHDQIVTLSPAQAGLSRWRSDNLANAETKGLEVSLYAQPGRGLRLRGAYTYLDTAVLSLDGSSAFVQSFFRLGQQLLRRPRHAASYLASWQRGRLLVDAGAVVRGRTLDVEPNRGAGQFLNPFYATFDAGAQLEIGGGVTLAAKLRNAFDRTYEQSLGFPALGRSFTAGLRWRWRGE